MNQRSSSEDFRENLRWTGNHTTLASNDRAPDQQSTTELERDGRQLVPGGYDVVPLEVDPTPRLPRDKRFLAGIAQETVKLCNAGEYTNVHEEVVQLPMNKAVESTWLHPAGAALPKPPADKTGRCSKCALSVVQCSSLAAAQSLVRQGFRTCVLNFASGRNAGGGFLKGAIAQEEALARATGIYQCLLKPEVQAYYAENERERSCVYTDNIIVSPDVPVFRRDDGSLLDAPFTIGIVTSPAPNMGVAADRKESGGMENIKAIRRQRMVRVLALCVAEGFDAIVLGAWGCGVFRNDPMEVAQEFRAILEDQFCKSIPRVAFAIIDEQTCSMFSEVFGDDSFDKPTNLWPKPSKEIRTHQLAHSSSSKEDKRVERGDKSDRKARRWAKRHFDEPE